MKTYEFDQLSDEVKEHVIDRFRWVNVEHDNWYDGVFSYIKDAAQLMGIKIDRIYFAGFSFQNDGACFEGVYRYRKASVRNIKRFSNDKTLHQIALTLQTVQRKNRYKIEASVKHKGRYYHSGETDIFVYRIDDKNVTNADIVKDALREFMDWIYDSLQKEYSFLTSDKQVIETIKTNGFLFTENGVLV